MRPHKVASSSIITMMKHERSTIANTYGSMTEKRDVNVCKKQRERQRIEIYFRLSFSIKCGHRSGRSIVSRLYMIMFILQFVDSISSLLLLFLL